MHWLLYFKASLKTTLREYITMAQQSSFTIPTLDDFLANGLTLHHPSDLDEECGICTVSWRDDPSEVTALPCLHKYHRECIEHWMKKGLGHIATCPHCRTELCSRHELFRGWVDWYFQEEPWEGFQIAEMEVRGEIHNIEELVKNVWRRAEEDRVHVEWTLVVKEVLATYSNDRVQSLTPGSVEEYMVVKATVEVLRWFLGYRSGINALLEVLDSALETFGYCEEHPNTNSIQDAYVQVGLSLLCRAEHMATECEDLPGEDLEDSDEAKITRPFGDVDISYAVAQNTQQCGLAKTTQRRQLCVPLRDGSTAAE